MIADGGILKPLGELLWAVSWQAALLTAMIGAIALACRRATPAFRYGLWCIVLARLCLPVSLTLPLGLLKTAGEAKPAAAIQRVQPGPAPAAGPFAAQPAASQAPRRYEIPDAAPSPLLGRAVKASVQARPALSWGERATLAWLGIAAALGGVLLIQALRMRRIVQGLAHVERPDLAALLERLAAELKLRRAVALRCADGALGEAGPMTIGIFRPAIILPRRAVEAWPARDIEPVLAHELAHVRRHDLLVNWIQMIVQALYFFHPLVWFVNWRIRQEREWACDDLAVRQIGGRAGAYGRSILRVLEECGGERRSLAYAGIGMAEPRSSLSRRILRMMDGKYQAARQMGRWSLAGLIVVGAFCIALASEKAPEKKRPAGATPAAPAKVAAKAPEMGAKAPGTAALDPRIQKHGEETRQRITTFTDETTLTLAAGGAGDLKLKPNAARVATLRVRMLPPTEGLNFEVTALDGAGAVISNPPSKIGPIALDDGMQFIVCVPSARDQFVKLRITPRKAGAGQYQVGVKALVTRQPTPEEIKALLLAGGKQGRMMLDLGDLSKQLERYKQENGKYPDTLAELEIAIPRDPYSPKGEPYHYELVKEGYMLSSCGEDGIWGNDDDRVSLHLGRAYDVMGDRKTLIIPKDTPGEAAAQNEYTGPSGRRPKGNCLLAGRVISEKTGQPVDHATVHLYYADTLDSLFIHVASDGSFEFKDVPPGNYSLQVINTTGYQPVRYDPEGRKGDLPLFTLKEKEGRRGIEFKLKPSYRITGRVLDEDGKVPADARELTAIAWSGQPDQENATFRFITQAPINPKNGSFTLDGLSGEPVYLAVQDFSAHEKANPRPVMFYPGTLLRGEAKPVAFTNSPVVKGVEIRLTRKGGQVVEGVVTAAGTGKPVAGAMVVVHHADMLFDRNVAYTDAQGHYRFDCLGSGRYQIHVDATPQNLVRTRKLLALDPGKSATVDFTLKLGATLSGRITDDKGNDLPMVNRNTFGSARLKQAQGERSSFSGVPHKSAPKTVGSDGTCTFAKGEGDYEEEGLRYPTASSFIVQGLAPGEALLNFEHYTKGKKVLMIMHGAQDVLKGGLIVRPGEKIDDLVIVVGPDEAQGAKK